MVILNKMCILTCKVMVVTNVDILGIQKTHTKNNVKIDDNENKIYNTKRNNIGGR